MNNIFTNKNNKIKLFFLIIFFISIFLFIGYYNQKILEKEIENTPTPTIEILNKDFSGSIVKNYKTNNSNTGFLLDFKVSNADYITLNGQVLEFNTGGIYQKNLELSTPITNFNIYVKNKHKENSYIFGIERNITDEEKKKEEELRKKEEENRIEFEKQKFEEERLKSFYNELVLAQDKADCEAEKRYPIDIDNEIFWIGGKYNEILMNRNLGLNADFKKRLSLEYSNKIRKKFNILKEKEKEINLRAFKENWPLPIKSCK